MVNARIEYRLRLGDLPEEELAVLSFEGYEGLCEPFRFVVQFLHTGEDPLAWEELVGQPVLLTLARPEGPVRYVHGDAAHVRMTGVAAGLPRYEVRIEPRLSRLARVQHSRIFQEQKLPEVLQEVLDAHEVVFSASLAESYPTREYVAQFRESDLAFVHRLLEHNGAWYRFDHQDGGHELILGDGTSAYLEADPLTFRPEPEHYQENEEHTFELTRQHRLTASRAARRDFDFERPALDLSASTGDGDLEVYEYPGDFVVAGEGKRLVAARLQDLQYGAATFDGKSTAVRIQPGSVLELSEHRDDTLNGKRLIVRATHRGTQALAPGGTTAIGARYENTFEAIDGERVYRPRRATARPRMVGVQTATVVGAGGEEIHPDRHGRIKVQFHWDRDGKKDDHSSCWMRVAQSWAGGGMGATFLPRVGQEVVVRFLEGDPDRPLITGAVYNGANPPPVPLPDQKTQSGLKSDSSPGSGGYNALFFEDARDAELVLLHAQKDHLIAVEDGKVQTVGLDEALEVTGNRTQTIDGNQTHRTAAQDSREVGVAQLHKVDGSRKATIGSSDTEMVGGAQAINVLQKRSVTTAFAMMKTVGGARALTAGGGYMANVGGALSHTVGKNKATNVKGSLSEYVGAAREENLEKNRVSRTQGDVDIKIAGEAKYDVGTDNKIEVKGGEECEIKEGSVLIVKAGTLETDKLIIAVGGKEALSLAKNGQIKINGDAITFEGGGALKFRGKEIKKIAKGSGPSKKEKVQEIKNDGPANKTVKVAFKKGADGKAALNGVKFKIKLTNGKEEKGAFTESGEIAFQDLPPGKATLELVDLEEPKKPEEKK